MTALSPNYGFPQNGKVGDPDFRRTRTAMVAEAHARGLKVIPWTIDDPATMAALIDVGVDGIITNYPNRLRDSSPPAGCLCRRPTPSAESISWWAAAARLD